MIQFDEHVIFSNGLVHHQLVCSWKSKDFVVGSRINWLICWVSLWVNPDFRVENSWRSKKEWMYCNDGVPGHSKTTPFSVFVIRYLQFNQVKKQRFIHWRLPLVRKEVRKKRWWIPMISLLVVRSKTIVETVFEYVLHHSPMVCYSRNCFTLVCLWTSSNVIIWHTPSSGWTLSGVRKIYIIYPNFGKVKRDAPRRPQRKSKSIYCLCLTFPRRPLL